MFEKGRHSAKVVDYGFKDTNNGDPQIFIALKGTENNEQITWFGSLKEGKAREITLKTLIICGFTGNTVAGLAAGLSSNSMDLSKELSIVVNPHEYNGKTSMKVDWINLPNAGIQNRLTQVEAVQKVQGYNLEGQLMQLRRDMNEGSTASSTLNQNQGQQNFAADDIPF